MGYEFDTPDLEDVFTFTMFAFPFLFWKQISYSVEWPNWDGKLVEGFQYSWYCLAREYWDVDDKGSTFLVPNKGTLSFDLGFDT